MPCGQPLRRRSQLWEGRQLEGGTLDSIDTDPIEAATTGAGGPAAGSRVSGFRLGCRALYLRDVEPAVLLADPAVAPLAVLGAGTPLQRVEALALALRVIREAGGRHLAERLESAVVLATIRLDRPTIELAEEASMSTDSMAKFYEDIVDFYDETPIGRALRQRGRAEGVAEARAEGVAEGVEAGRAETLALLLVRRFGERPEIAGIARSLAGRADFAAACERVSVASLDELLALAAEGC